MSMEHGVDMPKQCCGVAVEFPGLGFGCRLQVYKCIGLCVFKKMIFMIIPMFLQLSGIDNWELYDI